MMHIEAESPIFTYMLLASELTVTYQEKDLGVAVGSLVKMLTQYGAFARDH